MRSLSVVLGLSTLLTPCLADDGVLYWGGNPELMHGKVKVRMVSENVHMVIKEKEYKGTVFVDCRFVFQNLGRACTVRVGFPDGGEQHEGDTDEPDVGLDNFRSWVDGKRVRVTVAKGANPTHVPTWHVQTVHFDAGQRRVVRDTYSQGLSGGATNSPYNLKTNVYLWEAAYEMDTGSSWYRRIGHARLSVRMPFAVKIAKRFPAHGKEYGAIGWAQVKPGEVRWEGFARPRILDKTMVFEASNFKPTEASNVHVFWPIPGGRGFGGEDYAHGG